MSAASSLNRLKNTYRPRYRSNDGSGLPAIQSGQNILSVIKDYFDSDSDVEEESLDLYNTISSGSETSSRFSLPRSVQRTIKGVTPASDIPTSSSSNVVKAHGQKAPVQGIQRSASSRLSIKRLSSPQCKHETTSDSESDVEESSNRSGQIMLAPDEVAADTQALVLSPTGFRKEVYRIDGSAVRDPGSQKVNRPAKRLSFENTRHMKPFDSTYPKTKENTLTNLRSSASDDVQMSSGIAGLGHSSGVTNYPAANLKQPDEDDFLIHVEETFDLDTWVGNVDKAHHSRKPQAKNTTSSTNGIKSLPDTSKSRATNKLLDSQVLLKANKVDVMQLGNQSFSSVSGNERRVSTGTTQTRTGIYNRGKAKDIITPRSIKERKALTSARGSFLQRTPQNYGPDTLSRCTKNDSGNSVKEGGKHFKCLPSPQMVLKEKSSTKITEALVHPQSSYKMQQKGRKQNLSVLEPSVNKTCQNSEKTHLEDENVVKRKTSSVFLQAATGHHPDRRLPHAPELPAIASIHPASEDDFSIDEDSYLSDSFITIPRVGKRREGSASTSVRKESEIAPSEKQKRGTVKRRDGCKKKQKAFSDVNVTSKQVEDEHPLFEQEKPFPLEEHPWDRSSGGKDNTSRKEGVNKNKVPLECNVCLDENDDESSISNEGRILQKQSTNRLSKKKNTNKKGGNYRNPAQKRGSKKVLSKQLPSSVQPNENYDKNKNLCNENEFEDKQLPKREGRKASCKRAPADLLPDKQGNEDHFIKGNAGRLDPAPNANQDKIETLKRKGLKKVSISLSVSVLRKNNLDEHQVDYGSAENIELASDKDKFLKKKGRKRATGNVLSSSLKDEDQEVVQVTNTSAEDSPKVLSIHQESRIPTSNKGTVMVDTEEHAIRCTRRSRKAPGEWWVMKSAVSVENQSNQIKIHGYSNDLHSDSSSERKKSLAQNKLRQNHKLSSHQSISMCGSTSKSPEFITEHFECLSPKTSLGKLKGVKDNSDQSGNVHAVTKPTPKSIPKGKSKRKIFNPGNTTEKSKEMCNVEVSPGELNMDVQNKRCRISDLRHSLMDGGDQPETVKNFRNSLVSFGAAYEKRPCAKRSVKHLLCESDSEPVADPFGILTTPTKRAKMVTPVRAPVCFERVGQSDSMDESMNQQESSPFNVQNRKTPGKQRSPDLDTSDSIDEGADGVTSPLMNDQTYDLSNSPDSNNDAEIQTIKLVMPSNTPNLRRSKRTRVKPLQYWRGERVNYMARPSGGFVVEGVISPQDKNCGRKHAAKVKNIVKRATGDVVTRPDISIVKPLVQSENIFDKLGEVSNGYMNMETVGPATVLDVNTGTEIQMECVKCAHHCDFTEPKENIKICKSLNNSVFSLGHLKLGPLQDKGYQFVCYNTLIFQVTSGVVEVTLHITSYCLKSGDSFFVPPGNLYNIKNLLDKEEAILVFFQIKGPSMFEENEDRRVSDTEKRVDGF